MDHSTAAAPGATRGPLLPFEGATPTIATDAFIAPTAVVQGNVEIGAQSTIWYHCVLRGDTNQITIGARSNIQDGTIVHVNAGTGPVRIGDDVTVGHAAIIHACTLQNGAFVGMGATVLDGATIETGGILAAGSVLPPGKRIGRNELWMGNPAKLARVMDEAAVARFARTAVHYVELGQRHRASLGL